MVVRRTFIDLKAKKQEKVKANYLDPENQAARKGAEVDFQRFFGGPGTPEWGLGDPFTDGLSHVHAGIFHF